MVADNFLNRGVNWNSDYTQAASPSTSSLGANVFLDKEAEDWKIEKSLRMLKDEGVKYIRQEFPWFQVELANGSFQNWEKFDRIIELSNKYGLEVIARLDGPPTWTRPGED